MKYLYFILIIFINLSIFPHDLWIQKENNSYVLYYGHIHPKQGESKIIPYRAENIFKYECYNKEGKLIINKFDQSYPVKITGSCDALFAAFTSGYWSKTFKGTVNKPKNEVDKSIDSWLSYEYLKKIEVWSDHFTKPLTNELEIVVIDNPFNKKLGDKLTFVVFYQQKPVKDIVVAYDERPVGSTDDEGKINIRIKQNGLQMISATLKEKGDGVKADHIVYTTILSFEIKK